MIDVEEIKKEVAARHDYLIGDNDPLMIMATMAELVLRQCVDELNAKNEEHLKAMLNALQKGNAEAKVTGGRVITEAAAYVSDQINVAVVAAMEEGNAKNEEARHEVHVARATAIGAAAVSVVCAVIGLSSLWVSIT